MLVIVLDCLSRKTISWSDHPNSLGNCSLPMLLSESHATSAAESHCQTPATSPQIKNWNTFYSGNFSIGKHIIGLKTIWKKLTGKIFTHRKYIFRLWIKRLLVLVQKVSTTYISKKISSFLFYNNFVWLLATPFWEAFTQGFSEKGSEHDLRTCL